MWKKRVQRGLNGWRRLAGVICDRVKGKVYKMVVRAAMLSGLETMALTKRQEAELDVAEFKMLRLALGVNMLDRVRNKYISEIAQVGQFEDNSREVRLR